MTGKTPLNALCLRRLDNLVKRFKETKKNINSDSLHDFRVAFRRFNSVLYISSKVYDISKTGTKNKNLKKIMNSAGELRDYYLHLEFIKRVSNPENKLFSEKTAAELKTEIYTAKKKLKRELLLFDIKKFAEYNKNRFLSFESKKTSGEPLEYLKKIEIVYNELVKKFKIKKKILDKGKFNYDEFHDLRIALKKMRYAYEIYSEALKSSEKPRLKIMKRVQTIMGDINDLRVLREFLSGTNTKTQTALDEQKMSLINILDKKKNKLINEFQSIERNFI